MKRFLHTVAIALGITTIYAFFLIAPLISATHLAVYHWDDSATALFLPTLLDFCILWLFLASLLVMVPKRGRLTVALWSAIVLALPWIVLRNWMLVSDPHVPPWLSKSLLGASIAAWLLLAVCWRPSFQYAFDHARHFTATLFAFVGIAGAVFLCQFFWFAWQARALNATLPLHRQQATAAASRGPRVLWIIFDELSYEQVYERRFPGLQLPAFDALAAQSTTFTHIVPGGISTEEVIPALLIGQSVDLIHAASDGRRLSVYVSASGAWQPFDQHHTVFQDALNAGYSTAVAGWYNPYCRILPEVLDRCFWTYHLTSPTLMIPMRSVEVNMLEPIIRLTGSEKSPLTRLRPTSGTGVPVLALHAADYNDIVAAADQLLQDRSIDFILVHLPIPHPAGMYDRKTGELSTTHSTYIDNLALADKCLAHLRSILERSGQWDSTAVVVMGDHSWRTKLLWSHSRLWTEEEQIASRGGQFDNRPLYTVKLPEQQMPVRISSSFAAVNTRALLNGIFTHSIQSPNDLSVWVRKLKPEQSGSSF